MEKLAMSMCYVKDMIYGSTHNKIYIRHESQNDSSTSAKTGN